MSMRMPIDIWAGVANRLIGTANAAEDEMDALVAGGGNQVTEDGYSAQELAAETPIDIHDARSPQPLQAGIFCAVMGAYSVGVALHNAKRAGNWDFGAGTAARVLMDHGVTGLGTLLMTVPYLRANPELMQDEHAWTRLGILLGGLGISSVVWFPVKSAIAELMKRREHGDE